MDKVKAEACEILDISQKIYQINESTNPKAIFKNKTFVMGTEEDRDAISIESDYEDNDSSYYFETPEIDGVIVKRENGNYCVKAAVKYTKDNQALWFAKIRIEVSYDGNIQIKGSWGGSWQQSDCEDEDLIQRPNSDFPVALDSMKTHLMAIYNELGNDNSNNLPEWVKRLKAYNN